VALGWANQQNFFIGLPPEKEDIMDQIKNVALHQIASPQKTTHNIMYRET
jgi:hypothetical protein